MQRAIVKSKGHQSVYDKALTIFQERTKTLKHAEQEIEKERIQTNIDHKFEERKVREDLFKLTRDRHRFAREARNKLEPQLPSIVNREKTFQGFTSREKKRLLRSFSGERNDDLFPVITCTDANIPRIMRRTISKESQFHNWLIGLPRIQDTGVEGRTFQKMKLVKQKAQNEHVQISDARAMKKHSKVQNIYNIPLTLRDTEITTKRHRDGGSRRLRKNKLVMIASQNWNFKETEEKLAKLNNAKQELS